MSLAASTNTNIPQGIQEPMALSFFWASAKDWKEAHETLSYLFHRYGGDLDPVRFAANSARQHLELLFDVFDRFTMQVCRDCRSICCFHARVNYDFRDVLFMHALELEPPPHQIREIEDQVCRYLGEKGCRLERIRRPFVCTWYYCSPMLELYYGLKPREQRRLSSLMNEAQRCLNDMEAEFMRITTI